GARDVIAQQKEERKSVQKETERRQKQREGIAVSLTMLNQIDDYITRLERKGLFSASSSSMDVARARARQSEWNLLYGQAGDPDLTVFRQKASDIVKILRDLGDIGGRAKAAYESTQAPFQHPYTTTAEGARVLSRQLRDSLDALMTGQPKEYSTPSQGGG